MEQTKKTAFGTVGLVVGIVGICLSFIPIINNAAFVLGALAVIFGIVTFCKKGSKGKAIAALILGILAIVITLTMQEKASQALENLGGDNTQELIGTSIDVSFGEFVIEDSGFVKTAKLPVTVKNLTDEKKSFSITVESVDENGNRIEDDTIYLNDLGAGQSQTKEAFTLLSEEKINSIANSKFKVVEISMY